jgi:hypothetical protein
MEETLTRFKNLKLRLEKLRSYSEYSAMEISSIYSELCNLVNNNGNINGFSIGLSETERHIEIMSSKTSISQKKDNYNDAKRELLEDLEDIVNTLTPKK